MAKNDRGVSFEMIGSALTRRKANPMRSSKAPSPAQKRARAAFAAAAKAGLFRHKKRNPLTRVKVGSPSMSTGEAPTKRLRKRRTKTARAPAGLYANPAHDKAQLLQYFVQWENRDEWRTIAAFVIGADAKQYAKAWHALHPEKTVRVFHGSLRGMGVY